MQRVAEGYSFCKSDKTFIAIFGLYIPAKERTQSSLGSVSFLCKKEYCSTFIEFGI